MANAPSINSLNEARIGAANYGPRLKANKLRNSIADYISAAAQDGKISFREVTRPPLSDWGKGLLPSPLRLRLCNPDKYPDDLSAVESEFRRVQGTSLLHKCVQAALAKLGIDYSVLYPPYELPTNTLQVRMVSMDNDGEQDRACCLIPQNTKLNGWPLKQIIPGKPRMTSRVELATLTDMDPDEICPVALPDSVTTCIDSSIMKLGEVTMSGGTPETALVMHPKEFNKIPLAYIVPGLALPIKPPH